jgi:hypothetical protein
MGKLSFITPLVLGALLFGAGAGYADQGNQNQAVTPSQSQQAVPAVTPAVGQSQQGQAAASQQPATQTQQTEQGATQAASQQPATQTQQTQQAASQQSATQTQQTEQGATQNGAQIAAMPKMLVIRVQHDKSGAEQQAEIFPIDETIKVDSEQAALTVIDKIQDSQCVQVETNEPSDTPAAVEQTFQSAEQGNAMNMQPVSWLPRWRFFSPRWNIYGYGYQPYYGYRYPAYYGNYGYYYNGATYPYVYYPYYYPYGYYNYYYYYNPYYYPY